jgi:hypothetical protein
MPGPFEDGPRRQAVRLLFSGHLPECEAMLAAYVQEFPKDPLGHTLRAGLPFYHHVAGKIRWQQAGASGLASSNGIPLPPALQDTISASLKEAQALAQADLARRPNDQNAVLALAIGESVSRDVMAVVFKKWATSLKHAQQAHIQARRLLELNPQAHDAYFVFGFSENLLSKVPSIFRPFAKIPGAVGKRDRAILFLEAAASGGFYYREFARQMLISLYLEDKRPQDALKAVTSLANDFPNNGSFQAELAKLQGTKT